MRRLLIWKMLLCLRSCVRRKLITLRRDSEFQRILFWLKDLSRYNCHSEDTFIRKNQARWRNPSHLSILMNSMNEFKLSINNFPFRFFPNRFSSLLCFIRLKISLFYRRYTKESAEHVLFKNAEIWFISSLFCRIFILLTFRLFYYINKIKY